MLPSDAIRQVNRGVALIREIEAHGGPPASMKADYLKARQNILQAKALLEQKEQLGFPFLIAGAVILGAYALGWSIYQLEEVRKKVTPTIVSASKVLVWGLTAAAILGAGRWAAGKSGVSFGRGSSPKDRTDRSTWGEYYE